MSEVQDLVIGAVGGYSWDKVDVWALSLRVSGFKGVGAVIVYDGHAENPQVCANLESLGFQVVRMPLRGSVFNQRFYDFYEVISSTIADTNSLRYALVTDVRDVYFQSNPMDWLEQNLHKGAAVVSEGIQYQNEAWNWGNLRSGFPQLADKLRNKPVYNVGVLAGQAKDVADLCLGISMIARSTSFNIADQSGLNVLLNMEPYASHVQTIQTMDGFAIHAGVMADPAKLNTFRPHLLEPEPVFNNSEVRSLTGALYPVVHQYDRVPAWNAALRTRLNEKLRAAAGTNQENNP